MMTLAGAIIIALALGGSAYAGAVPFSTEATVARPVVSLGDIVDLSRLPPALRVRARALTLANFPHDWTQVTVSRRWAVERARALLPVLSPWLSDGAEAKILVKLVKSTPDPETKPDAARCLVALAPRATGSVAAREDFAPADCNAVAPAKAFRYDAATRTAQLVRDLKPGDQAPAIPASELAAILPGERLYLSVNTGPVRVQREVETIQPAAPGRPLFVRARDGTIFAAPSPETDQ